MAEFSKLVITSKGQALLAKMIAGNGNVEFTKISASSATYTDTQLEGLTSLSNVMQTSLISNVTRINEVAIKVEAAFTNAELTEGYYMKVLGLYAVDPDVGEILYAVTRETSGNCYMPAYNGITVSGAYVKLVTTVGNAENISLEVDSGAYATIGDLKAIKESITAESIGAREIQKWTCPVKVGEWSRVLRLTDQRSGVLRVFLHQNSQSLIYEFRIGTGYSSGYLSQISANGSTSNSEIEIRIMRHKDLALDYSVEILNKFGYQGEEYVNATLEYEETLSNTTGTVIPYKEYVPSDDTYSIVKAELASKFDGIVAKKVYAEEFVGAKNQIRWTCPVLPNSWSRVAKLNAAGVNQGLITVRSASVSGQNCGYTYLYGIGYNTAVLNQIGSAGTVNNSDISVRIVKENANVYYFEVLNKFGTAQINFAFEQIYLAAQPSIDIRYAEYTPTVEGQTVIATIESKQNSIISNRFYGTLENSEGKAQMYSSWAIPVTIGQWSRIGKTDFSVSSGLFILRFQQDAQAQEYNIFLSTSDTTAFISQVSATGYIYGSSVEFRVTRSNADGCFYIEAKNNYKPPNSSATTTNAYCSYLDLKTPCQQSTVESASGLATDDEIVRKSLVLRHDGMATEKFYGDLAGNADTVGGKTAANLLNYNNLSNKPKYVTDIYFSGIKYSVSYSDGTRKEGQLNLDISKATGMLTRVAGNSEIYYYITIGESLVIGKEYQITRSPNYTTQVTLHNGIHTVEGDIYIGEKVGSPLFVIQNGSGSSSTVTVRVANCTAKDMWIPKTFNFTYNGSYINVTDIAY